MRFPERPVPARAVGIGLKPQHYRDALDAVSAGGGAPDFFEVHAENYFGDGGPPHRWLTAIREAAPLSIHGVSLSVGGRDPLDENHLSRLAELVARYEPALISEHLAWSADGGVYFNDLIAPPLSETSLARVGEHIDQIQNALGQRILIENPSSYLPAPPGGVGESDFLNDLAQRTGCGLLLDINNVFVSARNTGFDPEDYLARIDARHVSQIHLAGHATNEFEGVEIRIDDHGSPVCDDVMALFARFIARGGSRPALLEWDTAPPAFETLAAEAEKARRVLQTEKPEITDAA